jgi:hypothetical protein
MESSDVELVLMETSKALMLDEFEIINWSKFIERFDYVKDTFAIVIFFIGLATKLLLN